MHEGSDGVTLSRAEVRAAQLAAEKRGRGRRGDDDRRMSDPERPPREPDYYGPDGTPGYDDDYGDDYDDEEPGRAGWRLWVFRILKWGSISAVAMGILAVLGIWFAYSRTPIPEPNDFMQKQVSIVYYADGKTEMGRIIGDDGNRQSVKLSDVPQAVQNAHLAAEDRTFYQNNGVSVGGLLRAVKTSITGEAQVGGSTITQQYVKNYYLTSERTLSRKGKEILLAVKIDNEQSKQQILENYLNSIYYGRGAYGIQTAAKAYFGVDAKKLSVAQGAVLASVINAPELYDPAKGDFAQANLEKRFTYVLNGMVEMNWLTAAERAEITELPPIKEYKGPRIFSGSGGYLMAHVQRELTGADIGVSEQMMDRGGLKIVTTIDRETQRQAVDAVKGNLPKGIEAGLVAIKPGDGAILAMYGGADYAKRPLNNATQAIMQGGSNFKPFTVLAALQQGISTKTRFDGDTPQEFKGYPHPVNNYDDVDYGMVDMKKMIGRSLNTAFVALNEEIGPSKTKEAAILAGIPKNTLGLENDLGNVLGTASPHVIDMANAYATFAAQGVRSKPYLIKKVTFADGGTYEANPKQSSRRAFSKEIAADVIDTMTATVKPGGTATKIGREEGLAPRPVAGKTGTSEENKSKWFTGYVPQLAVSVGMYKPSKDGNSSLQMTDSEMLMPDGSTIPAQIWLDFMKAALEGVEIQEFPERAGVGDDEVPTYTTTTTTATTTTTGPTTTLPTTTLPTVEPTKTPPGKPTDPVTSTSEPCLPLMCPTSTTEPPPTTTTDKPGNGG